MSSSSMELSGSAEAIVVTLAKAGDRDAFEELVRRKQSWIRNLMRRLSNDENLADDLAQQVFLQVWRRLKSLRDTHAFNGWLKQMAINTWLQHARQKHPQLLINDDDVELNIEASSQERSQTASLDLDRALALLTPPVRLCIVLAYNEGMSHSEIENITEIPLGTVKSHIKRGSVKLKSLLAIYNRSALEVEEVNAL